MKRILMTQALGGLFLAAALVACGDDEGGGGGGSSSGGSAGDNGQATGGSTSSTGGSSTSTGGNTTGTGGEGGGGGDDEPTAECATYCSGAESVLAICSDYLEDDMPFDDEDDCLEQCAEQTNWDLDCRNDHRNNVVVDPEDDFHCDHAIGQGAFCADD